MKIIIQTAFEKYGAWIMGDRAINDRPYRMMRYVCAFWYCVVPHGTMCYVGVFIIALVFEFIGANRVRPLPALALF